MNKPYLYQPSKYCKPGRPMFTEHDLVKEGEALKQAVLNQFRSSVAPAATVAPPLQGKAVALPHDQSPKSASVSPMHTIAESPVAHARLSSSPETDQSSAFRDARRSRDTERQQASLPRPHKHARSPSPANPDDYKAEALARRPIAPMRKNRRTLDNDGSRMDLGQASPSGEGVPTPLVHANPGLAYWPPALRHMLPRLIGVICADSLYGRSCRSQRNKAGRPCEKLHICAKFHAMLLKGGPPCNDKYRHSHPDFTADLVHVAPSCKSIWNGTECQDTECLWGHDEHDARLDGFTRFMEKGEDGRVFSDMRAAEREARGGSRVKRRHRSGRGRARG